MNSDPNRKLDHAPAHVPSHLVVDWDFHHVPGGENDVHLAWKRLHDGPTVVWTPYYGGHWIVTRAEAIKEVQTEHETFSHEVFSLPRAVRSQPLVPLELDPPFHGDYRRILNLAFSPKVVNGLRDDIRSLARQLVENVADKGQCDFIADYARWFPVTIFLRLVDMPVQERERFLNWADAVIHSSSTAAQANAFRETIGRLKDEIDQRRLAPGTDVFSQIMASQVKGELIGEAEMLGMIMLLFFGGLDTVASMMGFVVRFLATHPGHRQQLVENPELIPKATDEFIRRFGLSNTARLIKHDRDFHGAPVKAGEIIMVPIALASMDERRWGANAMDIDFDRRTEGHDTFGNGPHRCPGANLARVEIQTFLEEWLRRIPDFEISPGQRVVTLSGAVNGVQTLPLSWKV
ncbi:MAG: cytochrome P450 [Burkholderiaceae bacterium]